MATKITLPFEICAGTSLPSGPVTRTAFGMPPGKFTLASTTSSRAMFRRIEDHERNAFRLGVQRGATPSVALLSTPANWFIAITSSFQANSYDSGSRSAGGDIVKVAAHRQCPRIIQALQRIWPRTQPFRGNRSLLRRIGQQFFFSDPALLVSLRSQRTGGVVGQFHFAGVARKSRGLRGRDVEEHLLGIRGDHMHRTVANLHRRPLGMFCPWKRIHPACGRLVVPWVTMASSRFTISSCGAPPMSPVP